MALEGELLLSNLHLPDSYNPYDDGQFQWYDWFIFALTLAISLGIGIGFAWSGQKTTSQYLMGNRSLLMLPVALSLFMSGISAILVLGNAAEMYQHGIQMWLHMFSAVFAYVLAGLIFVPLFFPLGITSSFEYLQMRFKSRSVKLTGAALMMISSVMYVGTATFSPATALESVAPVPAWASILCTGVIATVYTSIGGMKAVIWSDVFQGLVYIIGLFVVLIAGAVKVGGLGEAFRIAWESDRIYIDWTANPAVRMSFWSVMVGGIFSSLTIGTQQTSVQRFCALPNLQAARRSVWTSIPLHIIAYSLTCTIGIIVLAYYEGIVGCDPLSAGQVDNPNQLLPFFVVDALRIPALPGLFVSILFCGALSSISSSMNSLAAVTWKDVLEEKYYYLKEERKAFITKMLAAFFGVLGVGWAFFVGTLGGNVMKIANSFGGGVGGPLLGLFILGSFFPWSNWKGALFGAWFGLGLNMCIIMGESFTVPWGSVLNSTVSECPANTTIIDTGGEDRDDVFFLFKMSFYWFSAFGCSVCVLTGMLVSCCTGLETAADQDPLLIVPIFDRVLCCLPASWRRKLWCKVPHDERKLDEGGHAVVPRRQIPDSTENHMHLNKEGLGYEIDIQKSPKSLEGQQEDRKCSEDKKVLDHKTPDSEKSSSVQAEKPQLNGHVNPGYTQQEKDVRDSYHLTKL